MNGMSGNEKPGDGAGAAPANAPAGSGEGANTALEALIKKRRLRTEDDDSPTASDDPDLSAAQ